MYTLEIAASAEQDLDGITDYLGVTLANPPAALALLDEIDRVCEKLETKPKLFPFCNDSRLSDVGYRKAVVRAYIMIYEIDEAEKSVRVLRFFHESENYAGKL